jgi:tellurite resistance protein
MEWGRSLPQNLEQNRPNRAYNLDGKSIALTSLLKVFFEEITKKLISEIQQIPKSALSQHFMSSTIQSSYTREQIVAWLRGLLTIAWADGNFDEEEQNIITTLTQQELAPKTDLGNLEPITPADLAAELGTDPTTADNFLRTAVMVSLADGIYTESENTVLHQFAEALGRKSKTLDALNALKATIQPPPASGLQPPVATHPDVLKPVRVWLDGLKVDDPRIARFLCKMIPSQCPFERDVNLFGRKVVHIPPMCKLNPLYEQLVGLRFRALSYLADDRGEDVSKYC